MKIREIRVSILGRLRQPSLPFPRSHFGVPCSVFDIPPLLGQVRKWRALCESTNGSFFYSSGVGGSSALMMMASPPAGEMIRVSDWMTAAPSPPFRKTGAPSALASIVIA